MKFSVNMYLDNLWNPIRFQGHKPKAKVMFFLCSKVGYPWTVLSLEQGLMILFLIMSFYCLQPS